jgi:hypothetical protein
MDIWKSVRLICRASLIAVAAACSSLLGIDIPLPSLYLTLSLSHPPPPSVRHGPSLSMCQALSASLRRSESLLHQPPTPLRCELHTVHTTPQPPRRASTLPWLIVIVTCVSGCIKFLSISSMSVLQTECPVKLVYLDPRSSCT